MSKVFCPECRKILSQYAESCPNCSFPIAKYVQNAHLTDFSKTFVCPKCGSFNTSTDIVATIRCDFCGTPMFQTNEATTDTISNTSWPKTEDEIDSYIYSLLEKCNKVDEYDEKAHQLYKQKLIERVTQRRQQQSNQQKQSSANQPHCPTCGSTDIIKISAAKKAMGAGLFGLFSKTAKSQFECKNCGYKW